VRAWTFDSFGAPAEVLTLGSAPDPVAGPGQVLVRVAASAVNFADDLFIRGQYQVKPPLPAIAGMEVCGTIVGGDRDGERVAGIPSGMSGAFAEYAVLDLVDAMPVPESFTDAEGAAFTVAYNTAWFSLHRRGGLRARETVLVHAAAGGVGSASIQLAKAHGATVLGIAGSAEKAEIARGLGADHAFVRGDGDLVQQIKALGEVDLVVDPVGGTAHELSERVVGFEGRIAIVGFASGDFPVVRPERALVKNYSVVGVHWGLYRSRRPDVVTSEYAALCEVVREHGIRPLVSSVVPFEDAAAAVTSVASGSSVGRIVVLAP
jgi:NADPH2:quinone reductase